MSFIATMLFTVLNTKAMETSQMEFVPERMERTYVQSLNATPEVIIPLLAPRAETQWAHDWHPHFFFQGTGCSEQGSVFQTHHHGKKETWLMTKHDIAGLRSEFIHFNENTVCEITIQLKKDGKDRAKVELIYRYTALNQHGNDYIRRHFTKVEFEAMAAAWERELNAYLL